MKFCVPVAVSLKWISRLGTIIATPSKISPGAQLILRLKSQGARCSAQSKRGRNISVMRRTHLLNPVTPDIISFRKGAWNLSATWDIGPRGDEKSFDFTYRRQFRDIWE